jgi:hypothetical protein
VDFIRRLPLKILTEHHSVSDWDFLLGATFRSLSAVQYVSAPTSLRLKSTTEADAFDTVLCRLATTQNLPQGEIRSWVISTVLTGRFLTFRNQAALGSANILNCYFLAFSGGTIHLWRGVGGGYSDVANVAVTHVNDAWEHWRVVYWNGLNPAGSDALCVDIFKEITGVWTQYGTTMYDTVNQFKLSAINRAGLTVQTRDSKPMYFDDTEIWGP